jgi:hypothetical protein
VIALGLRANGETARAGGDVSTPEDAVAAEQRFLEELRRRVAWQAEAVARLRAEQPPAPAPFDPLDFAALEGLVAANSAAPRAQEWQLFLEELEILVEADGRLPQLVERLVRVVFAELLEER